MKIRGRTTLSAFSFALALLWLSTSAALAYEPEPCECRELPERPANVAPILEARAAAYQNGIPGFTTGEGGVHTSRYTDAELTELAAPEDTGDSCIWTGVYLASQAWRYQVTKDVSALAEVHRMAGTLDLFLRITGGPGYIARYAALNEFPWNEQCDRDRLGDRNCGLSLFRHGFGKYEGYYWRSNTSRDQYAGWWFGMWSAWEALHELNDAESVRLTQVIADDIRNVIDALRSNNFTIIDERGIISPSAPGVGAQNKLAWSLIAARVLGGAYVQRANTAYQETIQLLPIDYSTAWLNLFNGFYPLNLNHLGIYPICMLLEDTRRETAFNQWNEVIRPLVEHSWNAWFDTMFIAMVRRTNWFDSGVEAEITGEVLQALYEFQDPPNRKLQKCPPAPTSYDPRSVQMHNLLPGEFDLVAADPYPVACRCRTSFLWQRHPGVFECGSDEPDTVFPGVDYLAAYWLARFHGLIVEEVTPQPQPRVYLAGGDQRQWLAYVPPGTQEVSRLRVTLPGTGLGVAMLSSPGGLWFLPLNITGPQPPSVTLLGIEATTPAGVALEVWPWLTVGR